MTKAAHYFTGHEALETESRLGYLECQECAHGTAADIELHEDAGALCVDCIIGINDIFLERVRANPAAWVKRSTDAGKAFLDFLAPVPSADDWGSEETELRARDGAWTTEPTEPEMSWEPSKNAERDSHRTHVDLPAIGAR